MLIREEPSEASAPDIGLAALQTFSIPYASIHTYSPGYTKTLIKRRSAKNHLDHCCTACYLNSWWIKSTVRLQWDYFGLNGSFFSLNLIKHNRRLPFTDKRSLSCKTVETSAFLLKCMLNSSWPISKHNLCPTAKYLATYSWVDSIKMIFKYGNCCWHQRSAIIQALLLRVFKK